MTQKLTINNHDRDVAGLHYIYPVLSRRAGGLSIGINLNTNNACNWRCVYCQVPGLIRGKAPKVDLIRLERELYYFFDLIASGEFNKQFELTDSIDCVKDISISGNGEPTSIDNLKDVIELVGYVSNRYKFLSASQFVLITNGSLMYLPRVQSALRVFNQFHGQVWFKLDSATIEGRKIINSIHMSTEKLMNNLKISQALCDTSLQTCFINYAQMINEHSEESAYLELLRKIKREGIQLKKVMLYTLARASCQPEAEQITKKDEERLNWMAKQLKELGYPSVSVHI